MRHFIFICCLSWAFSNVLAQGAPVFDEDNIEAHIRYLASDKLQGRFPGTKGEKLAAAYIAKQFREIGLTPMGTKGWYQPFTWQESANPHATEQTDGVKRSGKNVVGYLDNGAEYTIVIGAHFDHLGLGHGGNSLDPNPHGKIHNGADDNASGVAGLIELARWLMDNKETAACNYLFIAFSGEEAGLIGSKRFCEQPSLPIKDMKAMINMDMIGRLDSAKSLVVGGVGTAAPLKRMVESVPHSFKISLDSSGIGPSDHTSFYLKNIPVLFFFTGAHSDYHKPSDDVEKINFAGELEVMQYIAGIVAELSKANGMLFTPTKAPESKGKSFKVTLGIMPDYAFEGPGVRVDGVTNGKPAHLAGLVAGDVIVKLGTLDIEQIYNYMDALASFKSGDKTTVVILRNGEQVTYPITFQ